MNQILVDGLIAEQLGWTHPRPATRTGMMHPPGKDGGTLQFPPNYFGDLDAMADAESSLAGSRLEGYLERLMEVIGPHYCSFKEVTQEDLGKIICATAAQRAEAFLKVLGLWDPDL